MSPCPICQESVCVCRDLDSNVHSAEPGKPRPERPPERLIREDVNNPRTAPPDLEPSMFDEAPKWFDMFKVGDRVCIVREDAGYRYFINDKEVFEVMDHGDVLIADQKFSPATGSGLHASILGVREYHGLDTPNEVFFYEQEFYVLSNFSSFMVHIDERMFPTAEHAYHFYKFPDDPLKQTTIQRASSAHLAFELAQRWKPYRLANWDALKVPTMRRIIAAKASQHEYVRRKLLETGERTLIENSWRDPFWGWGQQRDGQNMLGKLWMDVRAELRASR